MVGMVAAAASVAAGRALDLATDERLEEILWMTPGDPALSGWTSLETNRGYMKREVTKCEASEENRPATRWYHSQRRASGAVRGNTHRRGRVQESGRLRWILLGEMGPVPVRGSSTWMWPMLRIEQGQGKISERNKGNINIPKLVRAMQLNTKCINDEWLPNRTVTPTPLGAE